MVLVGYIDLRSNECLLWQLLSIHVVEAATSLRVRRLTRATRGTRCATYMVVGFFPHKREEIEDL